MNSFIKYIQVDQLQHSLEVEDQLNVKSHESYLHDYCNAL